MSSVTVLFVLDEMIRAGRPALRREGRPRRLRPRVLAPSSRFSSSAERQFRVIDLRTPRERDPEALDVGVAPDEALRSLADLRFVNRWLGNRAGSWRAVLPYLRRPAVHGCSTSGADRATSPPSWTGPRAAAVAAAAVDIKLLHLRRRPPSCCAWWRRAALRPSRPAPSTS